MVFHYVNRFPQDSWQMETKANNGLNEYIQRQATETCVPETCVPANKVTEISGTACRTVMMWVEHCELRECMSCLRQVTIDS